MAPREATRAVLSVFDPFLRLLTYSNATKSASSKHRTGHLTRAAIFAVLTIVYSMVLVVDLWYCYGFGFDLRVIAFPFAILINGTQLLFTYASLWKNGHRVKQIIARLAEIVDKRTSTLHTLA